MGVNTNTRTSVVYKMLEGNWIEFEVEVFNNNNMCLGFTAISLYPGTVEALLILGGISMDYKTKSE